MEKINTKDNNVKGGFNMRDNFLTVNQVAEIMGVSRFTIYRMVHNGTLPAYRVNNKKLIRFKQSDINRMLEGSKIKVNK